MMMRFLLYNIRYAAGIGRQFHLPVPYSGYFKNTNNNLHRIVQFVKSTEPDIVGLVEVDSGSFRSDKHNQAQAIASALQHQHIFQSKYSASSVVQKMPLLNKQGNAILTNQEVIAERFHYFRNGVKRLIIELELRDCSVFLVHLSLKFRHRQYQLQDLYGMLKEVEKPVIVAGDFNALRGSRELELFTAATGLRNANTNGRPSHPSRAPRRQLDYIFHSPDITITGFQIPQITLSDHTPLICDFEINHYAQTGLFSEPLRTNLAMW
jgi:endonuclease/exonuclease/phosphatase family metal-dependent hydrolase